MPDPDKAHNGLLSVQNLFLLFSYTVALCFVPVHILPAYLFTYLECATIVSFQEQRGIPAKKPQADYFL